MGSGQIGSAPDPALAATAGGTVEGVDSVPKSSEAREEE